MSLLIYSLIFIVMTLNVKGMITGSNSSHYSSDTRIDFEEVGQLKLDDQGLKLMHIIGNSDKNIDLSRMDLEEVFQYIEISYVTIDSSLSKE